MTYVATIDSAISTGDARKASTAKMRMPIEVGVVVWGAFLDTLAYGRSLGIDVQYDRGGGWLSKRGYITADGPWPEMRRFLLALRSLED